MSNAKRIQKKISKIQTNEFRKFILAMKAFCLFFKEYKQRQKSLKLVSGAVEPKGLITEVGKEMIVDKNFKIKPINDNLTKQNIALIELNKAINKSITDIVSINSSVLNLTRINDFPKQKVGLLGLEKQKDGSVKTVFAGSEDYKESH